MYILGVVNISKQGSRTLKNCQTLFIQTELKKTWILTF